NLVETQIFDEVGLLYPRRLIDAIVLECLYYRFQFYIVAHFVHYLTVFNKDNRLSSSNLRDISFTLSLRALRLSLRRCVKPSSHFHLPMTGRGINSPLPIVNCTLSTLILQLFCLKI